ncbi:MAG TPA: TfoX/Sxy family protein [Dehalococcoidia bacterium]|nr:TfoX/Sxy family protein [Dehalococcoidia bacterium]
MAYDESLAGRIRSLLGERPDLTERKMFGGLAFMSGGNMFCGVVGSELMVRTGKEAFQESLLKPGARPMDFTGRPMTGMLFVGSPGIAADASLKSWVEQAYAFARSLPAKAPGARSRRRRGRG